MISLKPVTRDNIDEVLALSIRDDQKTFVSTVAESLAQAYVYSETAYPFAVYQDAKIVGFIMMAYYDVKQYYTLWKLLIDKEYQHQGIGREALKQGIAFLKESFHVNEIYTGVVPENALAKKTYAAVGFRPTGLYEFGMEEWRLDLRAGD